jgi:hypothetical protein
MAHTRMWPVARRLWEAPINLSLPGGISEADVVREIVRAMADFAGVQNGELDLANVSTEPYARGVTLSGTAADALRARGFGYFLEGGKLQLKRVTAPEWWPGATPKPPKGRRQATYWPAAHKVIDEWLAENGYPASGDGEQTKLESYVTAFLAGRDEHPAESTIRRHVSGRIDEYRKALGR